LTRANAFTIDVEDWFHDESRPAGPLLPTERAAVESRVERNLDRLLEVLARHDTRATLFFLAEVATGAPALIRRALAQGHEIACHGLRHQPIGERSHADFRSDVRRARGMIEDVTGVALLGFRAPCFIRRREDFWALDVLASEGFRYDSSYMPLDYWSHRKDPPDERGPQRLPNGLWELPLPLSRVPTGQWLPCAAGGFALRALPFAITRHYLERFNAEVGPAILYTHPWEIDPDSGKLPGTPLYIRLFNGLGRRSLTQKLDRLLHEFRFAPIADVFAAELGVERPSRQA
jgi:polysaccharide deacetylase family protein (PEP-CTERM system associated)